MINDFLPWAVGPGANVQDQASFATDPALSPGASAGIVPSSQYNKLHRQASFVAAFVQQFVSSVLQIDVHDDGNSAAALTNFENALKAFVAGIFGNFYTFNGNPNGHVAGVQGTPTNPPDLCEDISGDGNLYMCVLTGPAATAQWLLLNPAPGASGVIQTGTVVANDIAAWAGNGVIKDAGLKIAQLMALALSGGSPVTIANGDFPMESGAGFVDSGAGQNNCVIWGGTSGGVANAQVLGSLQPNIAALTSPSLILFIAGAGLNNTGAMTLGGIPGGPKAVKKPSAGGPISLAGGEINAGNLVAVAWDGTQLQLLASIGGAAIQTTAAPYGKSTILVVNGGNPSKQLTATLANIVLSDVNGNLVNCKNLTATCDFTTNGANGLDTGTLAGSSGYYLHVISDGAGNFALTGSLNLNAPAFPGGYSYSAPCAWVPTDGSANFYHIRKRGQQTQYSVSPSTNTSDYPQIADVAAPSQTLTIQGVGGAFFPPDAVECEIILWCNPQPSAGICATGLCLIPGAGNIGSGQGLAAQVTIQGGNGGAADFHLPVRFVPESNQIQILQAGMNDTSVRAKGFRTNF